MLRGGSLMRSDFSVNGPKKILNPVEKVYTSVRRVERIAVITMMKRVVPA